MSPRFELRLGLGERHRQAAAALYYDAFAQLLAPILGEPAQALPILGPALDLGRAVAAVELPPNDDDADEPGGERLVGVCGLHFGGRHFVDLRPRTMLRTFGLVDGVRRIVVGGLLDRRPEAGELLIDGIAVLPALRGQGIGALLLGEVERVARGQGLSALSLDVAAENPGAYALYRRCGFALRGMSSSWLVRRAYGVSAIRSMSKQLPA